MHLAYFAVFDMIRNSHEAVRTHFGFIRSIFQIFVAILPATF